MGQPMTPSRQKAVRFVSSNFNRLLDALLICLQQHQFSVVEPYLTELLPLLTKQADLILDVTYSVGFDLFCRWLVSSSLQKKISILDTFVSFSCAFQNYPLRYFRYHTSCSHHISA